MFVGHFALALAARTRGPRPSLGAVFLAAQWLDLLWQRWLPAGGGK